METLDLPETADPGRPAARSAPLPATDEVAAAVTDRIPLIDGIKALACLAIVLHHLAFYGPMSDVAYPLMPALIDGLYHYGRMAVMAFLVVTGFLTARAFAPTGHSRLDRPLPVIGRRYLRLAVPMLAAMALAILVSALVRPWLQHESVSGPPTLLQLLAHLLLNNELLDQEALSAGVWYVGMDFQLFVLTALLLWLSNRLGERLPAARTAGAWIIVALTLGSLFGFNRDDRWDETAFYFFAYYGLGCMAWWTTGRRNGGYWLLLAAAVVGLALVVDFRSRIVVALGVMLLLGLARQGRWLDTLPMPAPVTGLARVSYSIFLVHFPLCLVVSAVVSRFFAGHLAANVIGMAIGFAVSIAGGMLFHRCVESRADRPDMQFGVLAAFLAAGGIGMLA